MAVAARHVSVRGVVQGVGFRPFVYRLAGALAIKGWIVNAGDGVEIHAEGSTAAIDEFVRRLASDAPGVAQIARIDSASAELEGAGEFQIRESEERCQPTTRISADLPVCDECLHEVFDRQNRRYHYPFINCTNCGPRYSLIVSLPYDRKHTTMAEWVMCADCQREFADPLHRRYHAQPTACPRCGPHYRLQRNPEELIATQRRAVETAAKLLASGEVIAVKGLGGYHLACDARNPDAVATLRNRKYRKEKPFALMARDVAAARAVVDLSAESAALLQSNARPIVLAPARVEFPEVAPDHHELAVMLPYTPLHHLLFDAGAPDVLVMTSANRSSEPMAVADEEAFETLGSIADAFLVGERGIARRVDDSVARVTAFGPMILRRARGYSPGAAAQLPTTRPVLAVGADLKNAITLVIDGQAFVSQHTGDLQHHAANLAFQETVRDLLRMYDLDARDLTVAHDRHPQYRSTAFALGLEAREHKSLQHHHAHIASVLAERGELDRRVLGIAFDGTGYGDDGTIWGGEFFTGSVRSGFSRVARLRSARLAGGDAASHFPPQAAAGFVAELIDAPDLTRSPFSFPPRYAQARQLIERGVRTFSTTSMGRLFDTVASLLGFTREVTYEGQAAIWLENLARRGSNDSELFFPFHDAELDFRPLLNGVIAARVSGRAIADIAHAFHAALAHGTAEAVQSLCAAHSLDTVVLSGGVFQNALLLELLERHIDSQRFRVWTNRQVPPNDGGISLGQAALAAL